MRKIFFFIKTIFKREKPSELDQTFEFFKQKLVEVPVTEKIISREKQFVMPTDPEEFAKSLNFTEREDDLSTVNFSKLPKELRIKIKQLIQAELKQEIV